jgi:hypothetical protein
MFRIKLAIVAIVTTKSSKHDNVSFNVIIVVMTRSQVLKKQVFRKHELVNAKVAVDWQTEL